MKLGFERAHAPFRVVRRTAALLLVCGALAGAAPSGPGEDPPAIPLEVLDGLTRLPGDLGALPPVPVPADNPQTPEKIELGRKLFFDTRFSKDNSTSCATCHSPEKGFADGLALAKGFGGQTLGRHTPTVLNAAYNTAQFWDGRATTLEQQAQGPIMAAGEMNMGSEDLVIARIKESKEYVQAFKTVMGEEPSLAAVGKAIAAYERTIVTRNSPFDRYAMGDKKALNDAQKRGLLLFFGKASCTECHSGPNFSDNRYHNLGVAAGGKDQDPGRFKISTKAEDRNAFKTPTVRNASETGPFMHDGSVATLEDLVEFYDKGGGDAPGKSKFVRPLGLTGSEKRDLVEFIKSLTGTVESSESSARQRQATVPDPAADKH